MSGYIVLAFFLGGSLGYIIFYLRYANRQIVDELRENLKHANKEIHRLTQDTEEYLSQNHLLKNKTSQLLEKNDDLMSIVSELSKYYFHIKQAAQKTSELTKFLQEPDENIERKMSRYTQEIDLKHDGKSIVHKSDFF